MKDWLKALISGVALLVAGTALAQEGDIEAGKTKAAACAGCHGPLGVSANPEWPSLAGLGTPYIVRQLKAFKDGVRESPLMQPQAQPLSEQDMYDLAAYFSSLDMQPAGADEALVDLGRKIYLGGIMDKGVPACAACHGPAGAGNPASAYPRIGGQQAQYMINALVAYRLGERTTDPNAMMRDIAGKLSDEEIRAVASYASGLYLETEEAE